MPIEDMRTLGMYSNEHSRPFSYCVSRGPFGPNPPFPFVAEVLRIDVGSTEETEESIRPLKEAD